MVDVVDADVVCVFVVWVELVGKLLEVEEVVLELVVASVVVPLVVPACLFASSIIFCPSLASSL